MFLRILGFLASYSRADVFRGPDRPAPLPIMTTPKYLSGILLLGAGSHRKAARRSGHEVVIAFLIYNPSSCAVLSVFYLFCCS